MKKRCLFATVLFMTCLSCWQRQEHDIFSPEIPYYTLSGYTVDIIDTNHILPSTLITLTAISLMYDVFFDPISVQSDREGYYQIDTVYPGNYLIAADRGGYTVVKNNIVVDHTNKSYDLELPEPFPFDYNRIGIPPKSQFKWTPTHIWVLGLRWSLRTRDGIIPIITAHQYEWEYGKIKIVKLKNDLYVRAPFFNPTCFEPVNQVFYWHALNQVLLCPLWEQTGVDFSVYKSIQISEGFYGMVWDGSGFWTTYGSSLQYRAADIALVEQSWKIDSGALGPLSYQQGSLWSYDKDNDLLLHLSSEGELFSKYRLIDPDTGEWIYAYDMDFGPDGNLWITGQKKGGIYVFNTGIKKQN